MSDNISPTDLREILRGFRVGNGFDVHRLVPERALILCGVKIPYDLGLLGHSDADVATHALMDAILGAAALGDIGQHFPDNDPRYKGADSLMLLAEVMHIIAQHGYTLNNADITIIAERPKMAPHIPDMRLNLARVMGVPVECVSVKATTTEHLGFTGRGEGIATSATATLSRL